MKNNRKQGYILAIFFGGFLIRLLLSFFGTLSLDHGTFVAWANSLASSGFRHFYDGWSDYLPGYPYILWILGNINQLHVIPEVLLFKLPAVIADILTGFLIYRILKIKKGDKWGLIGAAIYIFNPAVLFNSALWGQVDSLTAFTSMLAIYLLPENIYLSAISLAFGTAIKPQTAFVFPVAVFVMLKDKKSFADLVKYCLTGLSVFVLTFVPYWSHSNLITFILERLNISLNQYPYTSVNAFNFWGIVGTWKPDTLLTQFVGYIFVLILLAIIFFKYRKTKNPEYFFMSFIFGTTFVFFTRMHERHLLPVFAPLAVAAIDNPILIIPYLGFSVTYIANLYYSYVWITNNFKEIFGDLMVKFLAAVNMFLSLSIFYVLYKNIKFEWSRFLSKFKRLPGVKQTKVKDYKFPTLNMSQSKSRKILYLILAFAFITRVFNLGSPSTMYFDEVYHAFTAKVILSPDVAKAWEWWNTPPEGFAYEWTHPPLAKLGMVLGMLVFGQNSFGWRIPGAILGLGVVYLIYLLAKEIFKDETIGLLSAAAFSLDGLALVMSRIGMNDSYILFFALLALYLYLKDKNMLSAISFGLSLSSKWSAIWAVPIFGVIFLSQKKKLNASYLWFFTIPLVIYLGSYFDMFLTGHNLGTWWGMQQQIWWYHTGLRATHPYSSPWWTWPFLVRPIYLYTSDEINGWVSRIYAFGNPLVFWFGLTSVAICLLHGILEKNKKLGLTVFSYLIFFVPWALSPRIMFLYHYLPSIPFMAIAIGYALRRYPRLVPYFFIPSLILFIYFYPHWAGLNVPVWLDQSYYWVSSWR